MRRKLEQLKWKKDRMQEAEQEEKKMAQESKVAKESTESKQESKE